MEERIKNSSTDDLRSWLVNMESYRNTEYFDSKKYDKVREEITKRENNPTTKELITRELFEVCNTLIEKYGRDNVDQVLSVLPDVMRLQNAKRSNKR